LRVCGIPHLKVDTLANIRPPQVLSRDFDRDLIQVEATRLSIGIYFLTKKGL
jgi:hypothetical protein